MGTFSFIILINFARIIIVSILKIVQSNKNCKKNLRMLYEKVIKDLFFNSFLESTIEGFFTLLIVGNLNLRTWEFSCFGEIVGAILSYYSLLFSLLIILICIIWTIFTKDKKMINKRKFKKRWGALVKFLNYNNLISKLFYLIFILRR